jgi:hypothetical protein
MVVAVVVAIAEKFRGNALFSIIAASFVLLAFLFGASILVAAVGTVDVSVALPIFVNARRSRSTFELVFRASDIVHGFESGTALLVRMIGAVGLSIATPFFQNAEVATIAFEFR